MLVVMNSIILPSSSITVKKIHFIIYLILIILNNKCFAKKTSSLSFIPSFTFGLSYLLPTYPLQEKSHYKHFTLLPGTAITIYCYYHINMINNVFKSTVKDV